MAGKKEWDKGSPSVKLHSVQVFGDMQVAGAKVCKSALPRTSPQEQTAGDEHVASEK